MKELLIKLRACEDAREWAGDKTIEEIVEQCHRGDWLLWLAARINIGLQPLTLAKGHCANTIRHLMKDERSRKAVDTAIAFGEGRATIKELNDARAAARAASYATVAYAAANPAACDAAYATAYATAAYETTARAATRAAASAAASAVATDRKQNQMQTADICRKYIGQLIIDKCNEINKKQ
jgi:hypothetical protein